MEMTALTALFFLLGLLSGYTLVRLSRHRGAKGRERRMLVGLGWMLMGSCFALSAALLIYGLLREF